MFVGNYVLEVCNAPGNASPIVLAGAPAGRVPFARSIPTGTTVYYVMDDGVQEEMGIGVFNAGSPSTLTRDTVLWTSATGYTTPARLTFGGAVKVFTGIPAEKAVALDPAGNLNVPNHATLPTHAVRLDDLPTGNTTNGIWEIRPNGRAEQWGSGVTVSGGGCDVSFPRNDLGPAGNIQLTLTGQTGPALASIGIGSQRNANGFTAIATNSGGVGTAGVAFDWSAKF